MTNKKRPFNLLDDRFTKAFAHNNPELIKNIILKILKLDIKDAKLKYLNTSLAPSNVNNYLMTVDFIFLINDNILVNVEINNSVFSKVKYRNYIYISKIISNILKIGDKGNVLKKYDIYQININGNDKDNRKGIRVVKNYYQDNKKEYLKNVKIIEINLAYYKNLLYTENIKRKISKKEILLGSLKSKNIEEFDGYLKRCLNDEERKNIIKEVRDRMGKVDMIVSEQEMKALDSIILDGYKEELEEERELGKKEGLEQGLEQGIEKGIERGKNQSKL